MKKVTIFLCLVLSSLAFAHPNHETAPMPKDFDTLKKLVGTWEGTSMKDGKEQTVTVTYKLISGNTVIMEQFEPTSDMKDHDMVSMYYRDGKTLGMTHYCALGNQPHMTLKKGDGSTLAFEMTKPVGVSSMKESHMHAMTITVTDPNTFKEEWVAYEDGKPKGTAVFNFKRKN